MNETESGSIRYCQSGEPRIRIVQLRINLTAPFAVHDRAVEPVNPIHLLQFRAHRMSSVARALQSTDNSVLWEGFEVI